MSFGASLFWDVTYLELRSTFKHISQIIYWRDVVKVCALGEVQDPKRPQHSWRLSQSTGHFLCQLAWKIVALQVEFFKTTVVRGEDQVEERHPNSTLSEPPTWVIR